MSKHTPGPWELHDDEGWFMLGHKNRYVELAGNGKEAKANRALIARAPELLEENERLRAALEQAQSCILNETPEDLTHEEARQDTLDKIRAALNGGQS